MSVADKIVEPLVERHRTIMIHTIAKALALRDEGAVTLSMEELESAAGAECVMEPQAGGSLVFRCAIARKT